MSEAAVFPHRSESRGKNPETEHLVQSEVMTYTNADHIILIFFPSIIVTVHIWQETENSRTKALNSVLSETFPHTSGNNKKNIF